MLNTLAFNENEEKEEKRRENGLCEIKASVVWVAFINQG